MCIEGYIMDIILAFIHHNLQSDICMFSFIHNHIYQLWMENVSLHKNWATKISVWTTISAIFVC